ncbi:MAG TPA: DUF5706 domain-containing protein [Rhodocyclaceae bacterium]|nr:DUF5706 domain-containing protein [Rhodocyclaceae bacterium]
MEIAQGKKNDSVSLPVPASLSEHPLAPPASGISTVPPSGITHHAGESDVGQKVDEARAKFSEETHQYIREYIRLADQKAAFYFAGTTALLAFLYKTHLLHLWLKAPTSWVFADVLSFVASVGLVSSALACIVAVKPNISGSMRGIIFFKAITQFQSGTDYANEVLGKRPRELTEAKLLHTYDLSGICTGKYSLLNIVVNCGAIGVLAALALLFLSPA